MPRLPLMDKKRVAIGSGNHGHKTDARFVRPVDEGHFLRFKQGNGVVKAFHLERGGRAHGGCSGRLPEIGNGESAGAYVVLDPVAFREHAVLGRLETEETLVEIAGTLLVCDRTPGKGNFIDLDHGKL